MSRPEPANSLRGPDSPRLEDQFVSILAFVGSQRETEAREKSKAPAPLRNTLAHPEHLLVVGVPISPAPRGGRCCDTYPSFIDR